MKHFLAPLGVFFGGQLILLVVYLLWPALGTAETNLAADTADMPFWGWEWIISTGVIRILAFVAAELGVFYATFKAFMATRDV